MKEDLHDQLIRCVEQLTEMVRRCSSETIVGMCASYIFQMGSTNLKGEKLQSPFRHIQFLLGLMLGTPEPDKGEGFGRSDWDKAVELLNLISMTYGFNYFPEPGEREKQREDWADITSITMRAYLHYFNTGLLASVEQCKKRIETTLFPFSTYFQAAWGITTKEALEIADWIAKDLQRKLDIFFEAGKREKKLRLSLLEKAERNGWSLDELRDNIDPTEYESVFRPLATSIEDLNKVSLPALVEEFGGEKVSAYWSRFSGQRGDYKLLEYFTESNPASSLSLFRLSKDEAMCPIANGLYWSLLSQGEESLADSVEADRYFRIRDEGLEQETANIFLSFLGNDAVVLSSVYETPDSRNEHDLVIKWRGRLLIVESKASPPIEPFRDPQKSVVRLRRQFHSDKGIQKGFEQANSLAKLVNDQKRISVYNKKGDKIAELDKEETPSVYCVCITRDNYGPLAVDLSLLLEKSEKDEYPWVANILDLEYMLDGWQHLQLPPEKLFEYLDGRRSLHGRIMSDDELDIAGYFTQHNGFADLPKQADHVVQFSTDYSDLFDNAYMARYHGGTAVTLSGEKPVFTDLREALGDLLDPLPPTPPIKGLPHSNDQKVGRNNPCPCGSGRKYKHCCM